MQNQIIQALLKLNKKTQFNKMKKNGFFKLESLKKVIQTSKITIINKSIKI